eukprot:GCRY01005594.1.p1 GENE.GCRY01005594.1~~GCRY01005594.1.p1  ORF type:complete len:278 (-),score=22.68 GCRY01005594.1:760-1593(-)
MDRESFEDLSLDKLLLKLNSKSSFDHVEGLHLFRKCGRVASSRQLVVEYLQSSPECFELFKIWDNPEFGKKDINHALLFDCFSVLFLTGRKYDCFATTVTLKRGGDFVLARKIIKHENLSEILASPNLAVLKSFMELAVNIVACGAEIALELLDLFDFSLPHIQKLSTPASTVFRGKEVSRSVVTRPAFTKFVIALLKLERSSVSTIVLETKALLPSVLKYIEKDGLEDIDAIVFALSTHVLKSESIKRELKLSFFQAPTLKLVFIVSCRPFFFFER